MANDRFSKGPLEGTRIVDLTSVVLGPYATRILADLGADVIKVETFSGDQTRYYKPLKHDGMSGYFLNLNRNKRSICLDLKTPQGMDILGRLVHGAHAFIHNMRQQAADRLGLDYEGARRMNADIVYRGAVGFGSAGPSAVFGQQLGRLLPFAATTWFPAFAARLEQSYPQVVLEPRVGLSRPLEMAVTRGELDVASIAGPVAAADLQGRTVADIQFVWTSSPSRLRRRTVLGPQDFEAHPIINNPQDSGLSAAFQAWSRAHHVKVGKTIPCNSRAAIIALTIAGAGISFQPRNYVQPLFTRGLLIQVESTAPMPPLPYNLIWRGDDKRPLTRTIVDLVQEEADFDVDNVLWTMTEA